jgi:hypothetical protein
MLVEFALLFIFNCFNLFVVFLADIYLCSYFHQNNTSILQISVLCRKIIAFITRINKSLHEFWVICRVLEPLGGLSVYWSFRFKDILLITFWGLHKRVKYSHSLFAHVNKCAGIILRIYSALWISWFRLVVIEMSRWDLQLHTRQVYFWTRYLYIPTLVLDNRLECHADICKPLMNNASNIEGCRFL